MFLRSGQLMHRRSPLRTAETRRTVSLALGSSVVKWATHVSPTKPTTSSHEPALLSPLNAQIRVNTIAITYQQKPKTSKGEAKCQIKKVATHNITIRRSPVRSRNLETSRISQCNRNSRSRADSPKVRSRNKRNTIKNRKSRLRLQWI
jgi:hypothetical protein